MSRTNSTARRMTLGVSMVSGAAFAAAMLSMGTAYADVTDAPPGDQGYSILYGGDGTDSGLAADQAADNESLDVQLYDQNAGDAASFDQGAITFEQSAFDHPLENLLYDIDPSAYSLQTTDGITGTVNEAGAYLVPEDALAYDFTSLDYFLLTPTGLSDLLTPVIDVLLGSPPF
jgi:hypothetical protein